MEKLKISPNDIALVGCNIPNKSLFDGDFDEKFVNWRLFEQSRFWKPESCDVISEKAGLSEGKISSGGNENVVFKSDKITDLKVENLKKGDLIKWSFSAKTEYICTGFVQMSICFDDEEICLCESVQVPYGPNPFETYSGVYELKKDYSPNDFPYIKFKMHSDYAINVYVDWVDIYLSTKHDSEVCEMWDVTTSSCDGCDGCNEGIKIEWNIPAPCNVYRSDEERRNYSLIAEGVVGSYIDDSIINGRTYYYSVGLTDGETLSSYGVSARKLDTSITSTPTNVKAIGQKWTIDLTWDCTDGDIDYYNIYRKDINSKELYLLAPKVYGNAYTDNLPIKESENIYAVQAVDFSGNESEISQTVSAKVEAIFGCAFSDLIEPLPVTDSMTSDLWGEDYVLPRDPNNGIEDSEWSYWCARPVKDVDNKYHMNVVRWPESARKGHWEWPFSTIAYAVSDSPLGPYKVVRDLAYEDFGGLGHNATIINMLDGSYLLYCLVKFKPMLFSSKSMAGPWKHEGMLTVEYDKDKIPANKVFTLDRNLSGIQLEDESMLFVSKNGRMIKSDVGILGPYQVLTGDISENETVPYEYRHYVYEDPVMWRDEVQFHMIINAFIDFKAIYLRSADGLNWFYEDGFAYTPLSTIYEDGTRTLWHKMERPSVLTDIYGRATHLTLAVIDIDKDEDFGNDNHSSKSQILPLNVYKRTKLLNKDRVNEQTNDIKVMIYNEDNFTPSEDLDISSIIFGASDCVNFGKGAKAVHTEVTSDGLILSFSGEHTGLKNRDCDFAGKMIAYTKHGDLVVCYVLLI